MKNGKYNLEYYAPGVSVWFIDPYNIVRQGIVNSIGLLLCEDYESLTYIIDYKNDNVDSRISIEDDLIFDSKEDAETIYQNRL